jgi:acyl-CoA synthetase (NDP forming)
VSASRGRWPVGGAIPRNIVTCGFARNVYAVNPHGRSLEGVSCVASVDDLPEAVDLAVIAVPPAAVPDVATACDRNGVRALTVITSGLGARASACRRFAAGTACGWSARTASGSSCRRIGLNATFAAGHPAGGVAGLVVQSDGVGIALPGHLSRLGIGVSSFAS